MNRSTMRVLAWCAAGGLAALAFIYAINALTRGTGEALVQVTSSRAALPDGSGVIEQSATLSTLMDSRVDAMLARATLWVPLLLAAAGAAALATHLRGTPDRRFTAADLGQRSRARWVLIVCLAALSVVPSLVQAGTAAMVLAAADHPAGLTPLPVTVDIPWLLLAAVLLVTREVPARLPGPTQATASR